MNPFQYDRPVFVRIPFRAMNLDWKKNKEFKWKEYAVDEDKVKILYKQGYLYHDEDKVTDMLIGDGLETLDIKGLHMIVDETNSKIKVRFPADIQYNKYKMKKSTLADKQRGLIRSWRRSVEPLIKW